MSFIEVNDQKKKQPTNIIKGDPLDDVCGFFLHRLKTTYYCVKSLAVYCIISGPPKVKHIKNQGDKIKRSTQ